MWRMAYPVGRGFLITLASAIVAFKSARLPLIGLECLQVLALFSYVNYGNLYLKCRHSAHSIW